MGEFLGPPLSASGAGPCPRAFSCFPFQSHSDCPLPQLRRILSNSRGGRHGSTKDVGAGENHRLFQQPLQPPRRGGAAAQGRALRLHPGRHPQQERAAAQEQPRPRQDPRPPPRRPRRRRIARHRRVRRRGLRRAAAPAVRPRRQSRRPLLGPFPRREVLEAYVAGALGGGRGAGGGHEGDEGEPDAPGGAARGEEVLWRRFRRLPRHRRQRVRLVARRVRGDRGSERAHRRGPPGAAPVGERVHRARGCEAVPAG